MFWVSKDMAEKSAKKKENKERKRDVKGKNCVFWQTPHQTGVQTPLLAAKRFSNVDQAHGITFLSNPCYQVKAWRSMKWFPVSEDKKGKSFFSPLFSFFFTFIMTDLLNRLNRRILKSSEPPPSLKRVSGDLIGTTMTKQQDPSSSAPLQTGKAWFRSTQHMQKSWTHYIPFCIYRYKTKKRTSLSTRLWSFSSFFSPPKQPSINATCYYQTRMANVGQWSQWIVWPDAGK